MDSLKWIDCMMHHYRGFRNTESTIRKVIEDDVKEIEFNNHGKKLLPLSMRYYSNTFPYVIPIISDVTLNELNVAYRAYNAC